MYFVKYGDRYLHDPRTDDYKLFDLTLESEENTCGYCDFTIYPNHPMYNKIKERDTVNSIDVYDDDELLFSGFIYELGYKFQLDGHVKCKGDLSYLNDSIVRPYSTLDRSYGDKAPQTVNNYFEWLINQHNAQVDDNKKFIVGINQGSNLDPNNYILRENDKYPSTIEEIKEKLLDNLGGYIRTRKKKNIRYIDYIAEWSKANTQILDFGINLTDYAQTDDSAGIATFVVPLGAKISETEYPYDDGYRQTEDKVKDPNKIYYIHNYSRSGKIAKFEEGVTYYEQFIDTYVTTDASPVVGITYYVIYSVSETGEVTYMSVDISRFEPGVTYYERENYYRVTTDKTPTDAKDYYILQSAYTTVGDLGRFRKYETYYEYDVNKDESNTSLTIKGYEDKIYDDDNYKKNGDMIYHEPSVKKYGFIGVKYENTDLYFKDELIKKGIIALKELISPIRTIEIKAVDLHLINPNIKPIRIGEYVRVRSTPHNFDSYMLCTKIELNLNNPENSSYTLGTTFDTLTGEQNKRIKALNDTINKKYEEAASINENVKQKARDATVVASQALIKVNQAKNIADEAIEVATNASSQITLIDSKVDEAKSAASSAQTDASEAKTASTQAKNKASSAINTANSANTTATEAQTAADKASSDAASATATANAAKAEAAKATADVSNVRTELSEQIETLSNTMTADYAKKTDLSTTESTLRSEISQSAADITTSVEQTYAKKTDLTSIESDLETKINQNAEAISSNASAITAIDATANDAKEKADQASTAASSAQTAADNAASEAATAQSLANQASEAALLAQTKADKTEGDLAVAEENLAAVKSQADATNEQVAAVQEAVTIAKKAADDAQADATAAATAASTSQSTANIAKTDAATAQTKADEAKAAADAAQADVDDLRIRVAAAETSITQTANDVTVVAKRVDDNNRLINDASKTATNYMNFSSQGLVIGDMTNLSDSSVEGTGETTEKIETWTDLSAKTWNEIKNLTWSEVGDLLSNGLGNNILIDSDSVDIRNGVDVSSSFSSSGVEFKKPVTFTADGILVNNGDAYAYLGKNQVLWSNDNGYYMNESQNIDLATNISCMMSGVVFAWCQYDPDTSKTLNQNWIYFFVPKSHVINRGGDGIRMNDPYLGMNKYLYVSNATVTGHADNATSGTTNGITWDNRNYTLRYVIGV